LNVDSDEF